MRFRLRILLIVLALGPPFIEGVWLARSDAVMLLELAGNAIIQICR